MSEDEAANLFRTTLALFSIFQRGPKELFSGLGVFKCMCVCDSMNIQETQAVLSSSCDSNEKWDQVDVKLHHVHQGKLHLCLNIGSPGRGFAFARILSSSQKPVERGAFYLRAERQTTLKEGLEQEDANKASKELNHE